MIKKHVFILSLLVLLAVLFALSSCSEAGTESPRLALSGRTLTYKDVAVAVDKPVSVSPEWTSELNSHGDITYTISPEDLPTGLTFDTATGIIGGTPEEVSLTREYTITATAKDGGAYTGTQTSNTVRITILSSPNLAEYTLAYDDIVATVDDPVSVSPEWQPALALPDNVSYSIKNPDDSPADLPTGLEFDVKTGVITGTPTEVVAKRDYKITATAKDGGAYTGKAALTISIAIVATNDISGYTFRYVTDDRPDDAVAEIKTTVDVQIAELRPSWSDIASPPAVSYAITEGEDLLPKGLTLEPTGDITGTPTTASAKQTYSITLTATETGGFIGEFIVLLDITVFAKNDIGGPGYKLTYPDLSAQAGKSVTVAAAWESVLDIPTDVRYEITADTPSLPAELDLDTGTGAIEGTPSQVISDKTYSITATASGSHKGTTTTTIQITISPIPLPDLAYPKGIDAVAGSEITPVAPDWELAFPDDVSYRIKPALDEATTGLTFDTASGAISGTPVMILDVTYTVTAEGTDRHTGTTTTTIQITITPIPLPDLAYPRGIDAVAGSEITPVAPDWELAFPNDVSYRIEPALDEATTGLTLNVDTGAISGTPTAVLEQTYTVTAAGTDKHTGTTTTTIQITISPVNISTYEFNYPNNNAITIPVNMIISEEEAIAPTWNALSIAFPDDVTYSIDPPLDKATTGLTFDAATGSIWGSPAAIAGEKTYTVTAEGTNRYTGNKTATIQITITPPSASAYRFNYPIPTKSSGTITVSPVWERDLPTDLELTYTVAPGLPTGLTLDANDGSITVSYANLPHATAHTITATSTTTAYTGSTTGVFIDTLLLDIDYTPTNEGTAIRDRAGLESMVDDPTGTYYLIRHIDLSAARWIPLFSSSAPFRGKLHGNGYAIYNLNIEGTNSDNYQGLFAATDAGPTDTIIENLGIGVTRITGGAAIGALTGYARSTHMENITSAPMSTPTSGTATITASGEVNLPSDFVSYSHTGGLVGHQDLSSTLIGNAIGLSVSSSSDGGLVGGLVGENEGIIIGYATGTVTGAYGVGGLAGYNIGRITGYTTGVVTARKDSVGGLVGSNHNIVTGYATGEVRGQDQVGGLVGGNQGIVTGYATAGVEGRSIVGGLVGENNASAAGYATGAVTAYSNAGGLVGWNKDGTTTGYATGTVTGKPWAPARFAGTSLGGLVGRNSDSGTVTGYATGAVTNAGESAGGLVGENQGTVGGYATGVVTITGTDEAGSTFPAGGLVGGNEGIVTGYATGKVSVKEDSTVTIAADSKFLLSGLVGENSGTVGGYWDQESTDKTDGTGEGSTGRLTGVGISATRNIVYANGTYTDGTSTIFDPTVFTDAFALPEVSATWPKLSVRSLDYDTHYYIYATDTEITLVDTKIPLVQATVSDKDGTGGAGNGTIEVEIPDQDGFPESWPFLNQE